MKILLIEDSKEKTKKIREFILTSGLDSVDIVEENNLRTACKELLTNKFDLIIFDIFLPKNEANLEYTEDCSDDLIYSFSESKNYKTETLAISSYSFDSLDNSYLFNLHGIPIVEYSDSDKDDAWKTSLKIKLEKAKNKYNFDFIIFTALEKERAAYSKTSAIIGESVNIDGMNCKEVKIKSKKGLIIKPHTMGPVDMAITATKAIEKFQPKLVTISGICAGIQDESNFLDIIVPDICWFMQSGKFKNGEFIPDARQLPIEQNLATELEQLSENINDNKIDIKHGLFTTELEHSKVIIAPLVSSASVIADDEILKMASKPNRKVAGLDMEIFSVFNAANSSLCKPLFFAAKAVVDMANSAKGDTFHDTACIISARYITKFIESKYI